MSTTIALDRIIVDPDHNPRKGDPVEIAALAESIKANGLLQPILVRLLPHPPETYGLVAGHRRLAAVQALGWTEVACVITTAENVHELALTENVMREAMHPVDEYAAFAKLRTEGLSIAKIGKRFGLSERAVKQRLALGSLLPELRTLWREEHVTDQAARALAQAPADVQRQVLADYTGKGQIEAWTVNQILRRERVTLTDKRVKFVGLDAFKAAGGKVTSNLFQDEQWIEDQDLLDRLYEAKLETEIQAFVQAGWRGVYDANADDAPSYDTHDLIRGAQALEPEERAQIDVALDIGWDGKLEVEYWRPNAASSTTDEDDDGEFDDGAPTAETTRPGGSLMADPDLTKALSEDMSSVMTGFAQVYANQERNRQTVLAMLAYNLIHSGLLATPLHLKPMLTAPNDANKSLFAEAHVSPDIVGTSPDERLEWLMGLEFDDLVNVIWHGAAKCLDFSDKGLAFAGGTRLRPSWYAYLVRNSERRPGWKPTAENYFRRLKTAQIVEAIDAMLPLGPCDKAYWSGRMERKDEWWRNTDKRKENLVAKAEALAATSGWLPELLDPKLSDDEPTEGHEVATGEPPEAGLPSPLVPSEVSPGAMVVPAEEAKPKRKRRTVKERIAERTAAIAEAAE